jgi:prephenate dehydrogenase
MATTIGIVGLGQIGASIGLAIKAKGGTERLLGHDKDSSAARTAQSMRAIDVSTNLQDAIKDSQIVFLCLPLAEMRETLRRIGPMLQENAVVLDTAPIKNQLAQWSRDSVPQGCHHIGLVPTINPSLLSGREPGIGGAHAELFHRTTMIVVTPPNTPPEVEQLGMNIARLLGAKPMLTDMTESDGIMTTAHILPQLTSAALIEASIAGGGWLEARKLAGQPFLNVTVGMAQYDDPASIEAAVLSNPERVVHGLNVLMASLQGFHDDIIEQTGSRIGARLENSYKAREQWLDERGEAAWLQEGNEPMDLPGLGEQITKMFFGGRIAEASRVAGNVRKAKK